MALQPTWDLWGKSKELSSEILNAEDLNLQIIGLSQEKYHLEGLLGRSGISASELQVAIASHVADFRNVQLESIDPLHESKDLDCEISTQSITISGEFRALLEVLQSFDTEFEFARLTSVQFWTETNRKTKKKHLYAKIYLQNIQKVI